MALDRTVNVRLDETTHEALAALAEEWGASLSACVRSALRIALTKREIERHKWSWESNYSSKVPKDICFRFTVFTENWETDGCVNAETEEIAGRLALKQAVEAADG